MTSIISTNHENKLPIAEKNKKILPISDKKSTHFTLAKLNSKTHHLTNRVVKISNQMRLRFY